MTISQEAYLEHYGVKGMKWGVRREEKRAYRATKKQYRTKDPRQLSSEDRMNFKADYQRKLDRNAARRTSDTRSADRKKYDATREKNLREMSDDELKAVVNRMNMEKQYKSLSTELYSPGKFYAEKLLKTSGNVAIGAIAGYGVNKLGGSLAKKAGSKIGKSVGKTVVKRIMRR